MRKSEPAVKGRKRRRNLCLPAFLLAAAVALAAVQIPGTAVQAAPIDLTRPCSLTVAPYSAESGFASDLSADQVAIDLYQVADAVKKEGYDTYGYRLAEAYEEAFGAALSEQMLPTLTSETWRELSKKAAEIALNGEIEPTRTGTAGKTIEGLAPGLYLMVARDANGQPEDVESQEEEKETEPKEGEETTGITTTVKTTQYAYTFAPELISLPGKDPEGGVVNTANAGDWLYEIAAVLKPERDRRMGSLEIVKTLQALSAAQEPATFVFQVDAYLDEDGDGTEENIFSDVVGMTFTGAGDESVTLAEKIPVSARVVVEEIYSGSSYEIVGDAIKDGVIASAEEILSLEFTNTNDDHHRGGHGITNSFEYSSTNGWQWQADPEQPQQND